MNLGAISVSFQDDGDQPLFEPPPGTTPIWNETRVIGLFDENADLQAIRTRLEARRKIAKAIRACFEERLEDQVWERAWMDHFKPMRFGQTLWVCPTGHELDVADATIMQLDPGLAFGTGTHPTTALCLEWLDQNSDALAGTTVIDYGCGSGILGVAALLLGARHVYAIDIDPQALTATMENARKNGVEHQITTLMPSGIASLDIRASLVIANILARPLIELAENITDLLAEEGTLVLSGLLAEQAEEVGAAYKSRIQFDLPAQREDWSRLSGRRII